MKNKNLVCENLDEFISDNSINEGFTDTIKKSVKSLKTIIKKIGNYYYAMYKDMTLNLTLPVNIGISFKRKNLGDNALEYFLPSSNVIKLEPSLAQYKEDTYVSAILQNLKKQHRAINAKFPTIESYLSANRSQTFESIKNTKNKLVVEGIDQLRHYDKEILSVDTRGLEREISKKLMQPDSRPLLIWGAPGIGKTAIVKGVLNARKRKGSFLSFNAQFMTPEAWFMPYIDIAKQDAKGIKAGDATYVDLPKGNLPLYKVTGDPILDKKANDEVNDGEGGIIFFDELSRCSIEVQGSCLTLMGERELGDFKLGDKWIIIAAANRHIDESNSRAINFSSTLGNRCRQVNYEPTYEDWKTWGERNGVNPIIFRFLDHNYEQFWYTKDRDNEDQAIFASPRTWEEVSQSLLEEELLCKELGEKITKLDKFRAIAGAVGNVIAEKMVAFLYITDKYNEKMIANIWSAPNKAPVLDKGGKSGDALVMTEVTAITLLALSMKKGKKLEPSEWTNFCKWVVSLNHAAAAGYAIKLVAEEHAYMNPELGDYKPELQKYAEGANMLEARYGDLWTGNN